MTIDDKLINDHFRANEEFLFFQMRSQRADPGWRVTGRSILLEQNMVAMPFTIHHSTNSRAAIGFWTLNLNNESPNLEGIY